MKLTDLKFYVPIWSNRKLEIFNLFHSTRVLESVALYKTGRFDDFEPMFGEKDWCRWCFGDTWGRVEWEFSFGDPFPRDLSEVEKQCVYDLFIKPNEALLKEMVDKVSVNSCKEFLKNVRTNRCSA